MNTGRINSAKAGFTRTELVVVLTVVALLIAGLFPLLSWAKLRSQRLRCAGGPIKEMLHANASYGSEHDRAMDRDPTNCPGGAWMESLRGYYRSESLLLCPSAPIQPPLPSAKQGNRQGKADQAWTRSTENGATYFNGSIGRNVWLYKSYKPKGTVPGMTADEFQSYFLDEPGKMEHPEKTPVFMDANWIDARPMETDSACNDLYSGRTLSISHKDMGRLTIARHGNTPSSKAPRDFPNGKPLPGGINVALYDGHVEWAPLNKLWSYEWHRDWKTPTVPPEVER